MVDERVDRGLQSDVDPVDSIRSLVAPRKLPQRKPRENLAGSKDC